MTKEIYLASLQKTRGVHLETSSSLKPSETIPKTFEPTSSRGVALVSPEFLGSDAEQPKFRLEGFSLKEGTLANARPPTAVDSHDPLQLRETRLRSVTDLGLRGFDLGPQWRPACDNMDLGLSTYYQQVLFPRAISGITKTPEFSRSFGVMQMSACHTERGAELTHSRGAHGELTAEKCYLLASNIEGLTKKEQILATLAALLHDAAHPPFSHQGEDLLKHASDHAALKIPAYLKPFDLDHDSKVLELVLRGNIAAKVFGNSFLAERGIQPLDIAAVLADTLEDLQEAASRTNGQDFYGAERLESLFNGSRHLHFLVKELADRCAYLEQDLYGLKAPARAAIQAKFLPESLAEIIEVREIENPNTGAKQKVLAFKPEAISSVSGDAVVSGQLTRLLALRELNFTEGATHPTTLVVNHLICTELEALFTSGTLDVETFLSSQDREIISLLSPQLQTALKEKIENRYKALGIWLKDDFIPEAFARFKDGTIQALIQKKLESHLGKEIADQIVLEFCWGANSKGMEAYVISADGSQVNKRMVSAPPIESTRGFFIAIPNDLEINEHNAEVSAELIRTIVASALSKITVDGKPLLKDKNTLPYILDLCQSVVFA